MPLHSLARRMGPVIGAAAIALATPAVAQTQPSTQELLDKIEKLSKRIEQLEAAEKQRQAAAPAAMAGGSRRSKPWLASVSAARTARPRFFA